MLVANRRLTLGAFAALALVSFALLPLVGQDFFPSSDAGLMKLHFRAPPGTRIERTDQMVGEVEQHIRRVVTSADGMSLLHHVAPRDVPPRAPQISAAS